MSKINEQDASVSQLVDFHILVPARENSQRLPGKLLKEVAGIPLLAHVLTQAKSSGAKSILVATDSPRLAQIAEDCQVDCFISREHHDNGTARITEAIVAGDFKSDEIVINWQADEPELDPQLVQVLAATLAAEKTPTADYERWPTTCCGCASAFGKFASLAEIQKPERVKVMVDKDQYALLFSRVSPLLSFQDLYGAAEQICGLHFGVYAYRCGFLRTLINCAESPLEKTESLEQLKILWHGYKIKMLAWQRDHYPGIDTLADLQRFEQSFLK